MILREARRPSNYAALWRMLRVSPHFVEDAGRYLLGRGDYPYTAQVRTPAGLVDVRLDSHHDMITVNELFCRLDYDVDRGARTIVDIGSNIGISALFFLTRTDAHVRLFEPVPRNIERLRENLARFESRYTLTEAAVASFSGTASFSVEDSGRYGGLRRDWGQSIDVQVMHINTVLGEVLSESAVIDLLKLDTEGSELETVRAIDPQFLPRIRTIIFEADDEPGPLFQDVFDYRFRNETARLTNRRLAHV
jgi:FkbM family methyltransferase